MAEATLPTMTEIEALPRRARVAFAARCARRSLPFFLKDWPTPPSRHVQALLKAVEVVERFATKETGAAAAYAVASASYAAASAAAYAAEAGASASVIRFDYQRLIEKAEQHHWTDDSPVPPSVFDPITAGVESTTNNTDPMDADEHIALSLQTFGEPGVTAATLAEHILAVYQALNKYTLAKYGRHLARGDFKRLVLHHTRVPAA